MATEAEVASWLAEAYKEAQKGLQEGGLPIGDSPAPLPLHQVLCWWTPRARWCPVATTCGCRPGTPRPTPRWWPSGRRAGGGTGNSWPSSPPSPPASCAPGPPCSTRLRGDGSLLLPPSLRVIVGENKNFSSFAETVMAQQGVKVELLQVSVQKLRTLFWQNTSKIGKVAEKA